MLRLRPQRSWPLGNRPKMHPVKDAKNPAGHAAKRGCHRLEDPYQSGVLWRLDPPDPQIWKVKASGCCCRGGDDFGHRPMVAECPAVADSDVASRGGGFDLAPSAMRRKADHGIPNAGAGATAYCLTASALEPPQMLSRRRVGLFVVGEFSWDQRSAPVWARSRKGSLRG